MPQPPQIRFTVNNTEHRSNPRVGERLSETLRETLGYRDVKIGCNAGDCGACTVLVDGLPVCACLTAAQQAQDTHVQTLTGLLSSDQTAQNLAQSFQNFAAAQCGICTPGMMVSAVALLRKNPTPSTTQIQDALGGVLCRCTGYRKIIDAVANGHSPLKPTSHLGHIGQSIERIDGHAKVEGHEIYGDDIAPVGTPEILIIRSPFAHASFAFDDFETLQNTAGVLAILTHKDIPGQNLFGVIPAFVDQPVFAHTNARFRGEAVAAIVATPDFIASYDPDDFPIKWQQLSAVETVSAALRPDAPQLHKTRPENIMCSGFVKCGDATAALQKADVTVSARFQSGFVEHAYIEPEAGFAELVDGKLHIYACTQAPVMDREALELILGMGPEKIRIIPTGVGGGFGAKLDISVQPYLALGALKTGGPVRLAYSRRDSLQSTTKRHPSDIKITIGASRDGTLQGFNFMGDFNTGAYASWGPTVANRVPVHASGPYRIADYTALARGIHTHNPPAGAFRGFGVPQSAIAQECLFDELAQKLDLDPLEFRIQNVLTNDTPTVCGQTFGQGVGIKACLKALRPAWAEKRTAAEKFNATSATLKRGVGVAAGWYGCGNTSLPNPSTIKSGITPNGVLFLHQGAMDIGQGSNTVIAQIFATALGVPIKDVTLIGADTDITPDAGKTSASRQTYVSGNAARLSGADLRAQILQRVNASDAAEISFTKTQIIVREDGLSHRITPAHIPPNENGYVLESVQTYDPPTKPLDENGQGEPYAQFGYAAHLAEIEIDITLGTVRATNFVAAHDLGKAINPLLVEGQVEGGIAQGLGMALMEEYIPGRTENLHDYLIPTIGDIPPIQTIIIEDPDAHGPYGAKGLGEHVLIPTAPALLNAIHHATGVRLYQIPATPSHVHSALKGQK